MRRRTGDGLRPVTVGRVLLFDRPVGNEHIPAGRLVFSDDSVYGVGGLPSDARNERKPHLDAAKMDLGVFFNESFGIVPK